MEFVCRQEVVFLDAVAQHVHVSQDVTERLTELHNAIQNHRHSQIAHSVVQVERQSASGRPRIVVPTDHIAYLLETGLPVTTISHLLGVSRATLFRRMAENNLSVRGLYSTCTDAELDGLVSQIKERMPHAGYGLIKGTLEAQGHRLQWNRVKAAMHRVDSLGILTRMTQMGCVIRRMCTQCHAQST